MAWDNPQWTAEPVTVDKLNTRIRDNMNTLKTPESSTGNLTLITINSTTWAESTFAVNTVGGDIFVLGYQGVNVSSGIGYVDISIDGNSLGGTDGICAFSTSRTCAICFLIQDVLAGSHTVAVRWKSTGSFTFTGGRITVREVS